MASECDRTHPMPSAFDEWWRGDVNIKIKLRGGLFSRSTP